MIWLVAAQCSPIPITCWGAAEWNAFAAISAVVVGSSAALVAWRQHQLHLFQHFLDRWTSQLIIDGRRKINQNASTPEEFQKFYADHESRDTRTYYQVVEVGNFFELMGTRVERRSLRLSDVAELWGPSMQHYHHLFSHVIEEHESDETFHYWSKMIDRLREKGYVESDVNRAESGGGAEPDEGDDPDEGKEG